MQSFVRATRISNVTGRSGYIKDPERQEEVVAKSEPLDWKPYIEFEKQNQKTATRNNEARELMITLPNEWYHLPKADLENRVQHLAEKALGKKTDMEWAVHWNKARTNFHVHVLYSERTREKNLERWDRNIYQTANGKIARKKSERARDVNGNYILVHRKGELKGNLFTAKDKRYKSREWLHKTKLELKDELARMGAEIAPDRFLHEFHEGKGKEAPIIRQKNEAIRANNESIEPFLAAYPTVPRKKIKKLALEAVEQGCVLQLERTEDDKTLPKMVSLVEYYEAKEKVLKIAAMENLLGRAESMQSGYSDLVAQKSKLGFFQFAEKKDLQQKIDMQVSKMQQLGKEFEILGIPEKTIPALKETLEQLRNPKPDQKDTNREQQHLETRMRMVEAKSQIKSERSNAPASTHSERSRKSKSKDKSDR